ncbi:DUF2267 domain-containing protein [Microvirga aerophila]|uniref:DUF2267 domain-containing protein n=1 Tax=Microvirga aerophila TaxID=670291 RepID=A0A512BZ45_9HYPH|nr:DUF2267 domain-containing protein [Microvirga aerophila]GEO17236.1 hypothetical protein MAE02_49320 [Microvirga aerophila]
MSASGLDVFDKTLQTTHIWLNEIMDEIGADKPVAWSVLGAVVRAVRDRIPLGLAAHLGAELPLLVRGVYYDQWSPATPPERYRSLDRFLDRVTANLGAIHPVDPHSAARAVFRVLSRHVPEGQIRAVREALPAGVRALWPPEMGNVGDPASVVLGRVTAQPEPARNIRT